MQTRHRRALLIHLSIGIGSSIGSDSNGSNMYGKVLHWHCNESNRRKIKRYSTAIAAVRSRFTAQCSLAIAVSSRAIAVRSRAIVVRSRTIAARSRAIARCSSRANAVRSRAIAGCSRVIVVRSRVIVVRSRVFVAVQVSKLASEIDREKHPHQNQLQRHQ